MSDLLQQIHSFISCMHTGHGPDKSLTANSQHYSKHLNLGLLLNLLFLNVHKDAIMFSHITTATCTHV